MDENEKEPDVQPENNDAKNEQEPTSEPLVDGGDVGIEESDSSETTIDDSSETTIDDGSETAIDDGPLVKSVEMSEFGDANILSGGEDGEAGQSNIDMILDISIPIAVELGRTTMLLKDVLTLAPGSIVELTKLAGDTVDLMIRGKLVAKGEVVVVDDNFGMRITSICGQEERIKHLS